MSNQHYYKPPPDVGLDILYQDEYLLVLNKPAGLLAVPGNTEEKQDCLASRTQKEFPQAMIVHRLDMCTSGIMLMALGKEAQKQFSIMFEKRHIKKLYSAIVSGNPEPGEGNISLPLITDWPNRPRQKVDYETGKPSTTLYRVMEYDPMQDVSRVELEPVTGRSHQLRVHMQSIGHAICGDRLYAAPEIQSKAERLLLHASFIEFTHPFSGKLITLNSPAPF